MRKPDVVIVGAQKAATTGLLRTLALHPDVCVPGIDEATVLHVGADQWDRWVRRYEPHLDHLAEGRLVIVKLATAMYFADTLECIKDLKPTAKVVVLLRHPIGRMLSLHRYAVQHGLETRSAEAALSDDGIEHPGRWRLRTYSGGSRYASALRHVRTMFDPRDVLYIDYAEAHTDACITSIEDFLGLDHAGVRPTRVNESRVPRSAGFARATSSTALATLGRLTVPARWRDPVRRSLQGWNATGATPPPAVISDALRVRLVSRHLSDVDAAESALSKPLAAWRQ